LKLAACVGLGKLHKESKISFEDQLGALAQKLQQARQELDASLQSITTSAHNRMDGIESAVAADIAAVKASLQEAEDGIIRHRDAIMQEFHGLAMRITALEAQIKLLLSKP
jgi:hypothetical protein